jgi:hypothetical protein
MATQFKFPRPSVHHFNSVSEIIEQQRAIDGNQEGWVAEFADGQRFKFKGERYLELSRLAAGLSFGNTVRAFARGELDILRARVPEEFEEEFNGWVNDIRLRLSELQDAVEKAFSGAPKSSRKRFADWVREQHPDLAPYLFQKFDGRDIRQLILQRAFADRSSLSAVKG